MTIVHMHGPAVIVDDTLDTPQGPLKEIIRQVEDAGLPLIRYTRLPDPGFLFHWRQVALIVLDWEMSLADDGPAEEQLPAGLAVPGELEEDNSLEMCAFLRVLLAEVYAPIFIMSNQSPDLIQQELARHLGDLAEVVRRRIGVYSKTEASVDVLAVVGAWLERRPAVNALKQWTNSYVEATMATFAQFEQASGDWVSAIASSASADGVSPSAEISDVLSRNVMSRMRPLDFPTMAAGATADLDGISLREVLHLRAVMPDSGLAEQTVGSGDIYVIDGATPPHEELLIVVTPDCDLLRSAEVRITVLPATPGTRTGTSTKRVKRLREHNEGYVSTAVLTSSGEEFCIALKNWNTYRVQSADVPWPGFRRLGRLMEPYLTNLQQRFGSHMTRKGLPALPDDFFE